MNCYFHMQKEHTEEANHEREKGEAVLAAAIRKQRAAMTRKGVPPEKVERECARLESAVRTRLWTVILTPTPNDAA